MKKNFEQGGKEGKKRIKEVQNKRGEKKIKRKPPLQFNRTVMAVSVYPILKRIWHTGPVES